MIKYFYNFYNKIRIFLINIRNKILITMLNYFCIFLYFSVFL